METEPLDDKDQEFQNGNRTLGQRGRIKGGCNRNTWTARKTRVGKKGEQTSTVEGRTGKAGKQTGQIVLEG